MRIHILSDLHLEFAKFEYHVVDFDVVVLAGDIHLGIKGIEWARLRWPEKEIIYVPGNHEYYHSQYEQIYLELAKSAKLYSVNLLNRGEVIIHGVRFLGATLWTDFMLFGEKEKTRAMRERSGYLTDFRVIQFDNRTFTPIDSVHLHEHDVTWLASQLTEPFAGNTVVITHHLPSKQSVSARYANEISSACFASDLTHLLGKSELWIHGHTHDSFDYIEAGTRVVCNPRGYVTKRKAENFDFDPNLVVEI